MALGDEKGVRSRQKKIVKLRWWCHIFKFVLALYSSSPSDLQFELLSVRVLLLLHCNCWTDLQYTKIITSRLIQFWFGWSRNYQLTWFFRIYSQPTCQLLVKKQILLAIKYEVIVKQKVGSWIFIWTEKDLVSGWIARLRH